MSGLAQHNTLPVRSEPNRWLRSHSSQFCRNVVHNAAVAHSAHTHTQYCNRPGGRKRSVPLRLWSIEKLISYTFLPCAVHIRLKQSLSCGVVLRVVLILCPPLRSLSAVLKSKRPTHSQLQPIWQERARNTAQKRHERFQLTFVYSAFGGTWCGGESEIANLLLLPCQNKNARPRPRPLDCVLLAFRARVDDVVTGSLVSIRNDSCLPF